VEAIFFLIFVAAVALLFANAMRNGRHETLERWFQEVLLEFRAFKVDGASHQHSFDGASSQVLRTERSGGRSKHGFDRSVFTVTIYAKNAAGEYFMFMKTSTDKPFFKYIEPNIAINVLHLEAGNKKNC
jgi:hypothetical protein